MTGLKESKGSPFSSRKLKQDQLLEEAEEEEERMVGPTSNSSPPSLPEKQSLEKRTLSAPTILTESPPLLLAPDDETEASRKTKAARVVSTTASADCSSAWPCANCHAMVSEERCPFCRGIQVKINKEVIVDASSSSIGKNKPEVWIERLSPATVLRRSPRPASPKQEEKLKSSSSSSNDKLIEIEDAEEELDASSASPNHDIQEHDGDDGSGVDARPIDPVAFTLASAPSPFAAGGGGGAATTAANNNIPLVVQTFRQKEMEGIKRSGTASGLEHSQAAKKQRIESTAT